MENWLSRTELLIKKDGLEKLKGSNVLIVGLGGVGSFAAEFIVRAGVETLTIVDGDIIDSTNINRQLPAMSSTIGLNKVDVMAKRLRDINPNIKLTCINKFLCPEQAYNIVSDKFDCVIDGIDSISPKLKLLIAAKRKKVKIVSIMGAGGKTDPSKIKIADISNTYHDMLSKQIRKRLKKHNINKGIRVVFSTEQPCKSSIQLTDGDNYKRSFYGTISYMPALFGINAAAEVIRYLLGIRKS